MRIGAHVLEGGACEFSVWAPFLPQVDLIVESSPRREVPLKKDEDGYWRAIVRDIAHGTSYWFRLDGAQLRPDPASRHQPNGVHSASAVVDHSTFQWHDHDWMNIELSRMVLYELHVGTFSEAGTFEGVIQRLDDLSDLGVNALELMPVAQFPGGRNWGYDGVCPFAVQSSYGGVSGLKRLVDESHRRGLAVFLDVVYNHLGPEGNYFGEFGPYFTERYRTPWGKAVNYDGSYSDHVRNYFIENALSWYRDFHIDALRLDAIHAIFDNSARPFLQELAESIRSFEKESGRKCYLISETDLNDTRILRPVTHGGFGHDAQWSDDFHHSVHALLTGENKGYYEDFGTIRHLIKSMREGFAYSGEFSVFRKRRHGNSSLDRPAEQFIISLQNHDQIGNRLRGERLSSLVSFEALKLAVSLEFLAPYVPLMFMGEEYAEPNPFLFFVSHSDPQLIEAVRKGRKEEFRSFGWEEDPPDAQDPETFVRSRLSWEKRTSGRHKTILEYYRKLIALHKELPALSYLSKDHLVCEEIGTSGTLFLHRWYGTHHASAVFNLNGNRVDIRIPLPPGNWQKLLDSADQEWGGPGSQVGTAARPNESVTLEAHHAVLMTKEDT